MKKIKDNLKLSIFVVLIVSIILIGFSTTFYISKSNANKYEKVINSQVEIYEKAKDDKTKFKVYEDLTSSYKKYTQEDKWKSKFKHFKTLDSKYKKALERIENDFNEKYNIIFTDNTPKDVNILNRDEVNLKLTNLNGLLITLDSDKILKDDVIKKLKDNTNAVIGQLNARIATIDAEEAQARAIAEAEQAAQAATQGSQAAQGNYSGSAGNSQASGTSGDSVEFWYQDSTWDAPCYTYTSGYNSCFGWSANEWATN